MGVGDVAVTARGVEGGGCYAHLGRARNLLEKNERGTYL